MLLFSDVFRLSYDEDSSYEEKGNQLLITAVMLGKNKYLSWPAIYLLNLITFGDYLER